MNQVCVYRELQDLLVELRIIAKWVEAEGWITKGHEETLGVMDVFITLIVVLVRWVYTYVKTYQCTF